VPFSYLDLKNLVYAPCGFGMNGTTVPTDVATRVGLNLNEAVRTILRDPEFGTELRHITLQISSVAGQALYAIPQAFSKIDFITQHTNDRKLRYMTLAQLRAIDPAERATGTPDSYVEYGRTVLFRQPATTGTGIWVASSDAADTTQVAQFQGVRLNGDLDIPRTKTLNGTARQQIGTFTDYTAGVQFTLATTPAGAVSLYDAAVAGNELARIPLGRKSVMGLLIRLWPTASAVLDYVIDGEILIQPMINDTDIPQLPEDYQDIPYLFAKMREYERTGGRLYALAKQEFDDRRNDLRVFIQFPSDYRPVAGQLSTVGRISTLGAWFPSNNNWP
jgi:hypothetical protein